jgi:hypothetical protein
VSKLHQHDFDWMLLSGVLRDAVTSFEVYLEKAREETLRHQGQPIPVEDESPYWRSQKRFFRQLGIEIETDEVKQVRELRNFLTPASDGEPCHVALRLSTHVCCQWRQQIAGSCPMNKRLPAYPCCSCRQRSRGKTRSTT